MNNHFLCDSLRSSQPGSTNQIVVALVLSLFYCCIFFHYRPYELDEDDDLGNLCQLAIFVTVFSCLIMRVEVDKTDKYDQNMLGVILVVVNFAAAAMLLSRLMLKPLKKLLNLATKKFEHNGTILSLTEDHSDPVLFVEYFERLALSSPEESGYKKIHKREVQEER